MKKINVWLMSSLLIAIPTIIDTIPPYDDLPPLRENRPNQKHLVATGYPIELDSLLDGKPAEVVFNDLISSNTTPYVVVDFYADWCKPCKAVSPILNSLAGTFKNVVFIKVNVDRYQSLSTRYGVRTIPTIICFKNGQPVSNLVPSSKEPFTKSALEKKFKSIFS